MAAQKILLWAGGIASVVYLYKAWADNQAEDSALPGQGGGGGGFGGVGEYAGNPYDQDGDGIPDASDPTPSGPSTGNDGYPDADSDGIPDINDYHYGPGAYPPEAEATAGETSLGDPRLTDADGDGTMDQWDYHQGEGAYPPEPGFGGDESYAGMTFMDKLVDSIPYSLPILVPTAAVGAYKGYKALRAPKPLLDFQDITTGAQRNVQRAINLRAPASGRIIKIADALTPTARVAQQTIGMASQTALKIADSLPSGVARIAQIGSPKAIAVANQGAKLTAATVRAASVANKPATVASDLAAGAARFAQATKGFTTRAAPVIGRAGVVVDVATGAYVAGRNVWDTGAAVGHAMHGDREAAMRASGGAVERGTGFLALGVADYNPNDGEVRIFNQRFTPDAPNSFGEAGRNVRRNFGTVGKNLKSGGRDNNRWTIWK